MKKPIILFSCISSLLFSMEPSANYPAHVHSALEFLSHLDLSQYKAIACYDQDSEKTIKELRKKLHTPQLCALDSRTEDHKCLTALSVPIAERLIYSIWHTPSSASHQEHDLIFSAFAFLFNPERATALDSLHASLKSGGHLIIQGLAPMSPYDPFNIIMRKLAQEKRWEQELKMFSLEEYELSFPRVKALLPSDKWCDISVQYEKSFLNFADNEAVYLWFSRLVDEFPCAPLMDSCKKQVLAIELTNAYILQAGLKYTGINLIAKAYKK